MVLHPGSHVGVTKEEGIKNIINGLNQVIDKTTKVTILLETMAGKGTECGTSFEELREIIEGIIYQDKIGVCLDTCHINDAGYDVSNFDKILTDFDKIIGLDKLQCIHVNDSKNAIGSKKDRHENIGYGHIGFDNLIKVIYNDKLKNVPKILETPYIGDTDDSKERKYPPYAYEIASLKKKEQNPNLLQDIRDYYNK